MEEFQRRVRETGWSFETNMVTAGPDATPLFDADGNRRSGTGEHIVYLRPASTGDEISPKSIIEVWSRQAGEYRRRAMLEVAYEGGE